MQGSKKKDANLKVVYPVHVGLGVLLEYCWPPVGFQFNDRLRAPWALVRVLTANLLDPKEKSS